MPTKEWDIKIKDGLVYDDSNIAIMTDHARLRKKDSNNMWCYTGKFEDSATLVLQNWIANAITSLYAFEIEVEYDEDIDGNSLGTIGFQISDDNGVTWYWWTGAAWATATTDWNTEDEIDANIGTFNFSGKKQLALRVKLSSSSDNKHSPRFKKARLHHDLNYDWLDDFKRTLKHYIEDNMRAEGLYREQLTTTTDTVTIDTDFVLEDVYAAYNLTDDPYRNNNIYQSNIGSIVTLSAAQDEDDIVEVRFLGSAPVFIAVDSDYQVSELPAIIIQVPTVDEIRELRSDNRVIERHRSSYEAKERLQPVWLNATTLVSCQSELEHVSIAMSQSLDEIFQYGNTVVSEASGEAFDITDYSPVSDKSTISSGLYVKEATIAISGKSWLGGATLKKLVQEVHIRARAIIDESLVSSLEEVES